MANDPIDLRALDMRDQGVGLDDPQLKQLQATEEADPEQEQALGEALIEMRDFIYSEKGMSSIVNIFNKDQRQLWESVPEAGRNILMKSHVDMQKRGEVDPAVFFGEGGLIQQLPPMLFEIAGNLGKPGADDPDQQTAALIGLYKAAGEYILEKGDEDAIKEVGKLGARTMLTGEDGEMMSPESFVKQNAKEGVQEVPSRVNQNLLGV